MFNFVQLRFRKQEVAIAHANPTSCPNRPYLM